MNNNEWTCIRYVILLFTIPQLGRHQTTYVHAWSLKSVIFYYTQKVWPPHNSMILLTNRIGSKSNIDTKETLLRSIVNMYDYNFCIGFQHTFLALVDNFKCSISDDVLLLPIYTMNLRCCQITSLETTWLQCIKWYNESNGSLKSCHLNSSYKNEPKKHWSSYREKGKRSDSVVWQKPLHPKTNPKSAVSSRMMSRCQFTKCIWDAAK